MITVRGNGRKDFCFYVVYGVPISAFGGTKSYPGWNTVVLSFLSKGAGHIAMENTTRALLLSKVYVITQHLIFSY